MEKQTNSYEGNSLNFKEGETQNVEKLEKYAAIVNGNFNEDDAEEFRVKLEHLAGENAWESVNDLEAMTAEELRIEYIMRKLVEKMQENGDFNDISDARIVYLMETRGFSKKEALETEKRERAYRIYEEIMWGNNPPTTH